MIADMLPIVVGEFEAQVIRADGTVEKRFIKNVVTYKGLNRLAARAINAAGQTPAYVLGVGTQTATQSLGSLVTQYGEVSRKVAAVAVQSQDWFALTMTWAGNTDGLTGIALDSVALLDHVDSGQGIAFNIAAGLAVTLQDSDFLNLTGRIRVGSHDLGHTT
jgi:hypothetical protein